MNVRELRCPSCDGPMSPVERRSVVIDLCRDCKGVFLDRGELDKLLDAAEADRAPLAAEADRLSRRPERDWDDDDDDERWGGHGGGRRRKRGGFLGDLFDFD
jgi:Zn-finger nucleic acid-binding protein